jgi:hypothetical protein
MYARMTRFAGLTPERIDDTLHQFQEQMLPEIERQPGYQGVIVMVNRLGGVAAAFTLWATEEDMKRSEELGMRAREQAVEMAQPGPRRDPLVDRYEVLLQRMR